MDAMDPKLSNSGQLTPPPMPKHKLLSTDAKLSMVADLKTRCFSNSAIEITLAKEWEVDRRTVRRFIVKVNKLWEAAGIEAPEAERAYSRVRSKAILEQVIQDRLGVPAAKRKADDAMVVIQAVREINRMDGHHVKRIEHTGKLGGPILHAHAVVSPQALAGKTDAELAEIERAVSSIIDMKALPPKDGG